MAFELHEPGGPVRLSFKTLDAVYDTRAVIGGDVHVQRGTPPRGALLSRNCVTQIVLRFQGTRGIDSLQFSPDAAMQSMLYGRCAARSL